MTNHQKIIFEQLVKCAVDVYGVDPLDPSRKRVHVWARSALAVELRRRSMIVTDIGFLLGKDHTSVLHGTKNHTDHMRFDKEYKELFQKFRALVRIEVSPELTYAEELVQDAKNITRQLIELGYSLQSIQEIWTQEI